jgi:predicted ATPase
MRLKSVNITGYRSLYDIRVAPGDFTVLTGPNNSGKTNIVEALDFLAETYRHGLEVAISRKGGLENIIHRRMARTRRSLAFEVEASVDFRELGYPTSIEIGPEPHPIYVHHRFVVVPLSQRITAEYQISEEYLSVRTTDRGQPFFEFSRTEDAVKTTYVDSRLKRVSWLREHQTYYDSNIYKQLEGRIRPTDLMLGLRFNPIEATYTRAMGNMRLYQLVPLEGRRPGVPTPNAEVDAHGANLPALVDYMQKNHRSSWRQVIRAMEPVVPELTEIKTNFTPDRRLALQFVERGVRRPWSAEDISDGTIQALGMYTAIFDPRASIILIEEPENSLHSWIIRNFVDACRQADRQIILTTHSAALLSYLHPSEVSLVWKRHGRTFVRPLPRVDPSIESMWNDGSLSIFEMLDSGLLSQAVPGGDT